MKKLLLRKVLTAIVIFAVGAYFTNLQGQVSISFLNDSAQIGHSTTGTIAPLTLYFKINDAGKISMDAFSGNPDSLVIGVVDRWDMDSVGSTDVTALFGRSFILEATSGTDRLQCGDDKLGGLGVQGKNQRRIDDGGTEFIYFELKGEVGLEFTSFEYNDVNNGSGNVANLRFIDYDSEKTYYIKKPVLTGDTIYALAAGELKMRNSLDSLIVSTCDTITTSDGAEGARLYGLQFNVVEPAPKALPSGQIAINFINETGVRVGNTATGGLNPLTLDFTIDASGKISMDASTGNTNTDVMAVVNSWDSDNVGTTDNANLFNKTFSLLATTSARIQCDAEGGAGGLGVQGKNQWRFDDAGKEKIYFELSGAVGLEFVSIKYNSLNSGSSTIPRGVGNLRFIDNNSDNTYFLQSPGLSPFSEYILPAGEVLMRYKTDSVTVTTSDTISSSDGSEGARLYGLVLNVIEPVNKPPAIVSFAPFDGDTAVAISSDLVISFDTPIDQSTASAITFSPNVVNRVNAWNPAGDVITISFDDLAYFTNYQVIVGTDLKGTNDLNFLTADTINFRTLPEPPSVIFTYPADNAVKIPVNTPLTVGFSASMVSDSVEKAITFDPAIDGVTYAWSDDHSKVYIIPVQGLDPSVMYTVTVGTLAIDAYGSPIPAAFDFSFTTATIVSVENSKLSDVVIYPNPASDLLNVRGLEVESMKIFSLTGQLVKEKYHSSEIYVGDIAPGSYIVNVSDRNDNSVRKLIVIE